ncbi:hypothetical protein SAMN05216343_1275 [Oscillibacter sp. PC13]|uniref:flavodoxin domain-containing protein n=1 Tax=Oscillibacter sp. PC13 TaxID=1855299 RepID=UPI0008F3ECB1|nr:hypothetical protein SAMN05216343_1275 [Oscillibacter sp. PC13]
MILYFSGTGNSKYVAKRIADALGDALVNLNDRIKSGDTSPVETGERVIIVTPSPASTEQLRRFSAINRLRRRGTISMTAS